MIDDCLFSQYFQTIVLWTTAKVITYVIFAAMVMSWTLKPEPVTVSIYLMPLISFIFNWFINVPECGDYCKTCNINGALKCDPTGCVTGSETDVNARYDSGSNTCQSKIFNCLDYVLQFL